MGDTAGKAIRDRGRGRAGWGVGGGMGEIEQVREL